MAEVGTELGVESDDLKEMRRQRRRDLLTRTGQLAAPIASVILGILAAEEVYPIVPRTYSGYPYVGSGIVLMSSVRTYYPRKSWIGPVILSVALFIVTFAFVGLFNSAANDDYFGPTTKYGVFSRSAKTGGILSEFQ